MASLPGDLQQARDGGRPVEPAKPGSRGDPHVAHGEPEAHERFLATRTFGSLDGLRALSIIAVVWHHTHDGLAGVPITGRGFLGVDLFFVISGFLIVTLLLREKRQTGGISLRGFYVRRFLRIFPAFYGTLLVIGAAAIFADGHSAELVRRDLPYAAFYVANLVPMQSMLYVTWSLSVEEQFYVAVPTLEKHGGRALPLVLGAAYLVVALPPFGVLPDVALPGFFREATFGPILLGVLLAHALDDPRAFAALRRVLGRSWSSPVAAALVLVASSHPAADISGWPRLAIHWAMLALVASCVTRERHALSGCLRWWPLRRIGAVSYGIYLYHLPVMHFVTKGGGRLPAWSQLATFGGTLLGTWIVAEASYHLYESRFLALKSRFAPSRPGPAAASMQQPPAILGAVVHDEAVQPRVPAP